MLVQPTICRRTVMSGPWPARTVAIVFLFILPLASQESKKSDSRKDAAKATSAGQQTFASTCSGCHGLDGRGSERAPSIAQNANIQRLSDAKISSIISNGIPGTGMPPFRSLGATQVGEVVSYVRSLQGNRDTHALPGDAKRGKEIFFGKGECSSCHAFADTGGFFGPDLSTFGSMMSAKAVLDAILNADRTPQPGYKPAAITTQDGTRLEGLIRNEDNFSVQLLSQDGSFHFFSKADLKQFEYLSHSPMPTDYAQRLTQEELSDLVSFMITSSSPKKMTRVPEE